MADIELPENLTPRQQELLEMLLKGIPPKEIAYNLDIAYNTFLFHQKDLYRKLGVHSVHELFTKYAPNAKGETANISSLKKTLPVKWLAIFGIVLLAVVISVIFFFLRKPTDEGHLAVFHRWNTFTDKKGSSIIVNVTHDDNIGGKSFTSYTMSGVSAGAEGWLYAGMALYPAPLTQQAMRKMTSFSFKVLGDGKSYRVNVPTTDTIVYDEEMNHYWIMFPTINDQISTITITVDDLMQSGHGRQVPFIRDNISSMEFVSDREIFTESSEPFNLKVWDIRIF